MSCGSRVNVGQPAGRFVGVRLKMIGGELWEVGGEDGGVVNINAGENGGVVEVAVEGVEEEVEVTLCLELAVRGVGGVAVLGRGREHAGAFGREKGFYHTNPNLPYTLLLLPWTHSPNPHILFQLYIPISPVDRSPRHRLHLPPAQPELLHPPARTPSSSTPQHNPTAAATHGGRRHRCWFSQRLMLPREPFSSEGVDDALPPPSRNSNHVCVHAGPPRLAADRRTPLSAIIPVFSNWSKVRTCKWLITWCLT
ncbi:hypothetical protein HN51_054225 [Arachis hypogaea]